MNEPLTLEVNVQYRGMESLIKLNVQSDQDIEEYIDMVRQHIRIAKVVIDKRLEVKGG